MGGTSWDASAYTSRVVDDKKAGRSAMQYHAQAAAAGGAAKAADRLDPKKFKNAIREARDSQAHPKSKPVFVCLDVTGSMSHTPQMMQAKLPSLMGLLTRKGYLADAAICMCATGDVRSDTVPLQIGQFEAGIELDDDIRDIYMEGNGGGNGCESYELPLYFLARMTASDAWEKRGEKGYAFIICDENLRNEVRREDVMKVFGVSCGETDIPIKDIAAEVLEKWHFYVIVPNMTSHARDAAYKTNWVNVFGQDRILHLEHPDGIAELIASTIGVLEDQVDHSALVADLADHGTDSDVAQSVVRSLAVVGSGGTGVSKLADGSTGLSTL